MVKKDKKAKSAEQKARVAAKQSKKVAQKQKKAKSRAIDGGDTDDSDIESVLEEYARKQALFLKVTEDTCEPPSPRTAATLLGSPSNAKELFLFGGESYNGMLASFFNDLFVYHIERDEWKKITSPNSPLPRSGHAWCRGGNAGGIYLFGGEFSSPKQGTFYHYNDFWRLEPSNREWTRIEVKGKAPSARSGHRMTCHKHYILLFGGFLDTSQQTKYLQDLWIYDCQNFVWHNPVLNLATEKPDARSSFSLHPHESGAVIYGGYSRVKSSKSIGKQGRGGPQATHSVLKPFIHEDTWFLRITPPPSELPTQAPHVRWERRKKPINSPNPTRAGATQAFHKGRGIMFGGVHDVEQSEEGIDSEFFNQLFAWNIDRNRFFPLSLRRAKAAPKEQFNDRKKGRGKADEAELLRNLAALEQKGNLRDVERMDIDMSDDEEEPVRPPKPVLYAMPYPRFNAQLAVQGDVLYIYGGTYEHGDREYNFDEMYAIDLGKLDGVQEIYRRELENWGAEESSESDSDDELCSEDEDMDDAASAEGEPPLTTEEYESKSEVAATDVQVAVMEEPEEQPDILPQDSRPFPRPFESLRDFYVRTTAAWQEIVLEKLRQGSREPPSIKELRKTAFEAAESKWWDSREEVSAEEVRQEEAGIGEVVSLAERDKRSAGPGMRR